MTATEINSSSRVDPAENEASVATSHRKPSLGMVCGMVVVLACAMVGTAPLHDNSFFTHLATGRLLLDEGLSQLWGGMADPYAFTSGGRDWVVQSWFASVLYAGAEGLAGAAGIRLLSALTCAAIGIVAWRLTRPAESLIPRVVLCGALIAVGASTWSSRPFMFGLLCLALALLAADRGLDPRWLVPIGWLWVNTHGSFPLGIVALAAMALGTYLDGSRPTTELRALRWLVGGIALGGVVNPVGPKLLLFPLEMLTKSESLSHIKEWQSPSFDLMWSRVFLLVVIIGIVAIARRPSYRAAIPFVIFLAASLVALRNINVAMIVFLPVLAPSMVGIGSVDGGERRRILRPAAIVIGVMAPLLVAASVIPGDFDLRGYPTAALSELDQRGLLDGNARVATQDYVGNLLAFQRGRDAAVFIDDRYELHDRDLVDDYAVLHDGLPEWTDVLERRAIDVVVWERESALGALLLAGDDWTVVYDDTTAPRPPDMTQDEWDTAVEAKPFIVACRSDFAPCLSGGMRNSAQR